MGENVDAMELDLNFEDLEFIGDDESNKVVDKTATGNVGKEANDGNPKGPAAKTAGPEGTAAADGEDEGVDPNIDPNEEIENEGDGTEGEGSEGVGTESAGEDGDGKETSPQLFQTFAETLREKGVFSSVDESSLKDIKDVDGLVEALKTQIKAEEFSDLTEVQREILGDVRKGTKTETATVYKESMDQLNAITDDMITEDQQVRFDLIYQDFISKGYGADKSQKLANRSFVAKEDLQDAKDAKTNLSSAVKARYDSQKAIDVAEQDADIADIAKGKEDLKDAILKGKEVLKGIEVPEVVAKEVYAELSRTVSTNPDTGEPENSLMKHQRENPVDFSHKLYYLYKLTNGFKDMEYFQKKKTTNSAKNFETALRQSTHVSGGGDPSFADDGESHSLDIGELILPED